MRLTALAFAATLIGAAHAGPNEDALIAADTAFSAMAQSKGVAAAFEAFAAPDARMFDGDDTIVSGPAQVRALMEAQYGAGGSLSWTPVEAVSSGDGTVGFTHGRWTYVSPKVDGNSHTLNGNYVTIWGRQPDGAYKFTLDIGQPDQTPGP